MLIPDIIQKCLSMLEEVKLNKEKIKYSKLTLDEARCDVFLNVFSYLLSRRTE